MHRVEKHCCSGWKNDIERGGKTITVEIYNVQLRRAVQKQKSYCYVGCCWGGYIPRPAIEIAGTRWCSKTWCALMHAKRASYVDENLAGADPVMLRRRQMPRCRLRVS